MKISRLFRQLNRFFCEKSSNKKRIGYYRSEGMKIGDNCYIGNLRYTDEPYLIEVGNHVAIADGALFITHDGGFWCFSEGMPEDDIFGRIRIGNNVHVGMKCIFLPNTVIGDNCIVGAGSVVRGKFPENSVIAGNPATVITKISVQKLIYMQSPDRLKTARMSDHEKMPFVKKHFNIE